jgi:hypothetical protein
MGDYYSLRFTAALTSRGAVRVRTLLHWGSWDQVHATFADMPRSGFIPFGGLDGAPKGWEQARDVQDVSGVPTWHVCCSIKVGTGEVMRYFFQHVLPPMLLLPVKVEVWNGLTNLTDIWMVQTDGTITEILESPQPTPS